MSENKTADLLKDLREKVGHLIDPALVEKYGDPFDENDVRNLSPTKRRENNPGMSIEDELSYLVQDVEILQNVVATMSIDFLKRQRSDKLLASIFSDQ